LPDGDAPQAPLFKGGAKARKIGLADAKNSRFRAYSLRSTFFSSALDSCCDALYCLRPVEESRSQHRTPADAPWKRGDGASQAQTDPLASLGGDLHRDGSVGSLAGSADARARRSAGEYSSALATRRRTQASSSRGRSESIAAQPSASRGRSDPLASQPVSSAPSASLAGGLLGKRPIAALASALLVVVSGAVAAVAFGEAGHRHGVLAVVRKVSAGMAISSYDLTVVQAALPGSVAAVPASEASRVVGRRAAVPLSPGSLLFPADLAPEAVVQPGEALVGLALKSGELPAEGVWPGEYVAVVLTNPPGQPVGAGAGPGAPSGGVAANSIPVSGTPGSDGGPAGGPTSAANALSGGPGTVLVASALVESAQPPAVASSGLQEEVSLVVPGSSAAAVTAAAAAGQVSVAAVSPGQ
jgi:flagella basal body P-ring formation protein FlgA